MSHLYRQRLLLDARQAQDAQIARLKQQLASPKAESPRTATSGSIQWFVGARGVGHGARPGVAPTDGPPDPRVPRDIEESL